MPDTRPTPGSIESRSAPEGLSVQGRRLRGFVPYGIASRDLGGWVEIISPGALANADLSDLVARVDHGGVPIGRYPGTLHTEDRSDGFHWDVDLPESRADIREAVERGDLCATSWQMIVGRDRWEGETRFVEEVTSLRDVTLATTPAYPSATAEYRTAPEPVPVSPTPEPQEAPVPEPTAPTGGGLRLEDRTADDQLPSVESRLFTEMASVPKGESRSLTLATTGPVTPQDLSTFLWDQLRPLSVILSSGIRIVDTTRKSIKWPVVSGDILADFYGELDPIDATDPDFDEFEITPKKIAGLVRGSSEAFDDSDPSLLNIVTNQLALIMALRLDLECLSGDGTGEGFIGLANVVGRQTLDIGGPLTDYDWWVKSTGKLAEAHIPPPYAWAAHPRIATELGLLKVFTSGESNEALPRPSDCPAPLITSQMALTAGTPDTSSIFVFAPNSLVLGRRLDTEIMIDRSAEFTSDSVLVRGRVRAALATPYPSSVVEITNVDTPVIA